MHNDRVRKLSKRLYKDLKSIRQAPKKELRDFLTGVELNVLVKCNNIKHYIDESAALIGQARGILFTKEAKLGDVMNATYRVFRSITRIMDFIRNLYLMEKQVEEATEAYFRS